MSKSILDPPGQTGLRADVHCCQKSPKDSCPICELCGAMENLLVCSRCKEAWYCSKAHQTSDWTSHKKTCLKQKPHTVDSSYKANLKQASENVSVSENVGACHHTKLTNRETLSTEESNINRNRETTVLQNTSQTARLTNSQTKQKKSIPAHHAQHSPGDQVHLGQRSRFPENGSSKNLADYVVKCMTDYGICVVDNFLGEDNGLKVLQEVEHIEKSGLFSDGELVDKSIKCGKKVRGDQIAWVEKGDTGFDYISLLVHKLDNLVISCNSKFLHNDISGRTKVIY